MAAPFRTLGGAGGLNLSATQLLATTSGQDLVNISVGTAAQVLTSNGAGVLPSFQTFPITSIPLRIYLEEGTTTGTAITWVSLTSQWCAGYSTIANTTSGGTTWTSPNFYLPPGTYTVQVRYTKLATGGQVIWTPFNGGSAGTPLIFNAVSYLDCYNASTVSASATSTLVITGTGVNQIKMTCTASSATPLTTQYNFPIMKFFITK